MNKMTQVGIANKIGTSDGNYLSIHNPLFLIRTYEMITPFQENTKEGYPAKVKKDNNKIELHFAFCSNIIIT